LEHLFYVLSTVGLCLTRKCSECGFKCAYCCGQQTLNNLPLTRPCVTFHLTSIRPTGCTAYQVRNQLPTYSTVYILNISHIPHFSISEWNALNVMYLVPHIPLAWVKILKKHANLALGDIRLGAMGVISLEYAKTSQTLLFDSSRFFWNAVQSEATIYTAGITFGAP